jgi:hypothetical protein
MGRNLLFSVFSNYLLEMKVEVDSQKNPQRMWLVPNPRPLKYTVCLPSNYLYLCVHIWFSGKAIICHNK